MIMKTRDLYRFNLKRLMKEQKLKAKQIADVLYVEPTTVYKLLSGVHPLSPEYIDQLCNTFKLDREYFFYDPDRLGDELRGIPPELLFSLRTAGRLPLEARRSIVDFVKFLIEKSEKDEIERLQREKEKERKKRKY